MERPLILFFYIGLTWLSFEFWIWLLARLGFPMAQYAND